MCVWFVCVSCVCCDPSEVRITSHHIARSVGLWSLRQGNMANKLANCVKATKSSGMIHINILFRFSLGDFFLIDQKLINYS